MRSTPTWSAKTASKTEASTRSGSSVASGVDASAGRRDGQRRPGGDAGDENADPRGAAFANRRAQRTVFILFTVCHGVPLAALSGRY